MRTVALLVMLVLTAACADAGGDAPAGDDEATSTAASEEASTTPTPAEAANALDAPVVFLRTGGIAGISEEIRIETDGAATVTTPEQELSTVLDAEELGELGDLLEVTDWQALEEAAEGETTVADDFVLTLRHADHDLTVQESDLPSPYPSLLSRLHRILDRELGY